MRLQFNINKICLRNIYAPWCKIQKDCIYIYQWIIHFLVATTEVNLVTIKQMLYKILSGQYWHEDLYFDLDLWQCELKINREHLLSKGIHYEQFDLHLSPCDLNINRGHLPLCQIWPTFQQTVQEILSGQYFLKNSSLTLTFDRVIWTWIQVINSLRAFTVPSLATFQQRGLEILGGHPAVWPLTWKSIGNIYSLGTSTLPSMAR